MLKVLLTRFIRFSVSILVLIILTFWFSVRTENIPTDNLLHSFGEYAMRVFTFDLGYSSMSGRPVIEEMKEYLTATAELSLIAGYITMMLGLFLGSVAALHRGSMRDAVITNGSIFFSSFPLFWLAQLFIAVFAANFNLIPSSDRINPLYDIPSVTGFILIDTMLQIKTMGWSPFINAAFHFILPTIALCMLPMTEVIRLTRMSMSKVMRDNYMNLAFSRGWNPNYIVLHHGLRNALPEIFKESGALIFYFATSIVIVEYAFLWPGIGTWAIESIKNNDVAAVNCCLIFGGFTFISIEHLAFLFPFLTNGNFRRESIL